MANVRRLVLDVLKPNEPPITELSEMLGGLAGVQGVDIEVKEVDRRVEKVRITLIGDNIGYAKIKNLIERSGASIHSVDRVSSGKKLIGS